MNLTEKVLEATKSELAALCAWASKDETRPHLAAICIDRAKGYVAATDGHRLLAWYAAEPVGKGKPILLPVTKLRFAINAKPERVVVMQKRGRDLFGPGLLRIHFGAEESQLKADGLAIGIKHNKGDYPPIEEVIPKYKEGAANACVAFNPGLFDGLEHLIGRHNGFVFQPGPSELDPVLLRIAVPGWKAVIMPMREVGTYAAPGKATAKAKKVA